MYSYCKIHEIMHKYTAYVQAKSIMQFALQNPCFKHLMTQIYVECYVPNFLTVNNFLDIVVHVVPFSTNNTLFKLFYQPLS